MAVASLALPERQQLPTDETTGKNTEAMGIVPNRTEHYGTIWNAMEPNMKT